MKKTLEKIVLALGLTFGSISCDSSNSGDNQNCDNCGYESEAESEGQKMCDDCDGGSLDGMLDMKDSGDTNDMGKKVDYPVAVLTCSEYGKDGLCIHRPTVDTSYFWDASGSESGPGRKLVEYRIYLAVIKEPDTYNTSPDSLIGDEPSGFLYSEPGEFLSRLRVLDDLGDSGDQDFWNIVSK